MRVWVVVLIAVVSGCATPGAVVSTRGGAESHAMSSATAQTRRTSGGAVGGRTQTIGLPLTRGQKIGLWAGVAVFLAYLMASDGEEDGAGTAEP